MVSFISQQYNYDYKFAFFLRHILYATFMSSLAAMGRQLCYKCTVIGFML